MTNAPGGLNAVDFFSTFGMTRELVSRSIVPIVAWNDGDTEVKCIGTGFFISASGLLMTAAHVVRDPVDEKYTIAEADPRGGKRLGKDLHVSVMLPVNAAMKNAPSVFGIPPKYQAEIQDAKFLLAPILWAQHWGREIESPLIHEPSRFDLTVDVAICKVQESPIVGAFQPLNIGLHSLKIGDRAVAIGYAEMQNIRSGVDYSYPELCVSVGKVVSVYPDNDLKKEIPTPGPAFEFNAKIPGKMSGSPILVGSGVLTKGVVSKSWQDENSATGCLIASVLGIPMSAANNKSIMDLMAQGTEGIARVMGADL